MTIKNLLSIRSLLSALLVSAAVMTAACVATDEDDDLTEVETPAEAAPVAKARATSTRTYYYATPQFTRLVGVEKWSCSSQYTPPAATSPYYMDVDTTCREPRETEVHCYNPDPVPCP